MSDSRFSKTLESDTGTLYDVLLRAANGKELLSIQEVADMFNLDYKVIYYRVTSGALLAYRPGSGQGKWRITLPDIVSYLSRTSSQRNPLEAVLDSLNQLNPEDLKFQQELDSYMDHRQQEVATSYSLNNKHSGIYTTNEVCALLEGRWDEISVA